MTDLKVGIQCSSIGQRCGIFTYSERLEEYLNKNNVKTEMFAEVCREPVDIINIQFEPGIIPPNLLQHIIDTYRKPIIVTTHFTGYLPQFYHAVDGIIFHNKNQIIGEPWDSTIIPHPALVYPNKDKMEMRRKYGIPEDKLVVGTAGFIAGTGKHLPDMVEYLLNNMLPNEYLYCITSFWKGGDFGYSKRIDDFVKKRGKDNQFKLETDFTPAEILNERMQCCDLLFTWNDAPGAGSTSGIAMDMIGAHRKLIVKDSPHYATAAEIENVLKGRVDGKEFIEDVLKALRNEDLSKVADPTPYSWDVLIKKYIDYYNHWLNR